MEPDPTEIREYSDDVDRAEIRQYNDDADRLYDTNPWHRDDNKYTWEMVSKMTRPEFERRRELHVIYGTSDPDREVDDPDAYEYRTLKGHSSLRDYIENKYNVSGTPMQRLHPHAHVFSNLFGPYADQNVHVKRAQHILLDKILTRQRNDMYMGDEIGHRDISQWRSTIPDRHAENFARGHNDVVDDAYRDFHLRQLQDLERHAARRVQNARRIVAQAKTRTILRGVASRLGRDDGAHGQPETQDTPATIETSSDSDDDSIIDGDTEYTRFKRQRTGSENQLGRGIIDYE
jgi:hypothetical protein